MEEKGRSNFRRKEGPKSENEQGGAGRPPKGPVPDPVASAIAGLAADFLENGMPQWTRREINKFMAAVDDESAKVKEPADLIERLRKRKSIPKLSKANPLSEGLLFLERIPPFQGVWQVLYGPYVDLLTKRPFVEEVHLLLAFCGYGQNSKLFEWSRATCMRNRQAAADEAKELRTAIKRSKEQNRWRSEFLDFLAVALALLQEAAMTRDAVGTRIWRKMLEGPELAFSSWPHCSVACERKMSVLVKRLVDECPALGYVVPGAIGRQLTTHVLAGDLRIGLAETVALYLHIRDGRRPDVTTEARALVLALASSRLPEGMKKVRAEILRQARHARKDPGNG